MSLIRSHSPPCLQLEEPRHLDCLQNSGAHGPTFTWTTLIACPMDVPVGGTQLPGDTSGVLSRCYCWWICFVASMMLNMAWWSVAGGQLFFLNVIFGFYRGSIMFTGASGTQMHTSQQDMRHVMAYLCVWWCFRVRAPGVLSKILDPSGQQIRHSVANHIYK